MELNSEYNCGNCDMPLRALKDVRLETEVCIVCAALNVSIQYDGPRLLHYGTAVQPVHEQQ